MRKTANGHTAKRTAAFLCNMIGIALLLIVIVLYLPLTLPRLFGYQMYTVVSGSMEPAISKGSLVYVEEADPLSLLPGDIIAYGSAVEADVVITHRIVENQAEEARFLTKGDANENADMLPVDYSQLIGRVKTAVPLYGTLAAMLSLPSGKLAAAGAVLAFAVLKIMAGRLARDEAQSFA